MLPSSVQAGTTVAAGEAIATIAAAAAQKTRIPGHLHITLAWVPLSIPADRLNWQNLSADLTITLIDPWLILSAPAELEAWDREPKV